MGQRHQIYIFYHTDNSRKKQLKKEIQCCVFHDQWCYGTLPLRNVVRFIRFQNKASGYQRISSSASYDNEDKFHALLALDLEAGVYVGAHDITGDVTTGEGWIDPDMGDNNDGITLMYFPPCRDLGRGRASRPKVKYCFMGLDRTRNCRYIGGLNKRYTWRQKKPLNARQYVGLYYKDGSKEWGGYKVDGLLRTIERNAEVLTLEECFKLLPEWFVPEIEREKIKRASDSDIPLFVGCLPENKNILEKRLRKGRS